MQEVVHGEPSKCLFLNFDSPFLQAYDDLKHFETPYVVKLHRYTPLSETQEVFSFRHPNFSAMIDNSRSCTMTFSRQNSPAAVCHGFAGYFDAELYKKVIAVVVSFPLLRTIGDLI